tara:strand:+ start:249 stop:494 length:246 start_codon:yes stop_codon:yes gene_type:complete
MRFFNFVASSTGGHGNIGQLCWAWQNQEYIDSTFADDYIGFTTIGFGDWSLEFGDIDQGNGIHLTHWKDGDVAWSKTFLKF